MAGWVAGWVAGLSKDKANSVKPVEFGAETWTGLGNKIEQGLGAYNYYFIAC